MRTVWLQIAIGRISADYSPGMVTVADPRDAVRKFGFAINPRDNLQPWFKHVYEVSRRYISASQTSIVFCTTSIETI